MARLAPGSGGGVEGMMPPPIPGSIFLNISVFTTKGKLVKRLSTMVQAWASFRRKKTFSRILLENFGHFVQPSLSTRAEIVDLERRLHDARLRRDEADRVSRAAVRRVASTVLGDPEYGEDRRLSAAMGFIAWAERIIRVCRERRKVAWPAEEPEQDVPKDKSKYN